MSSGLLSHWSSLPPSLCCSDQNNLSQELTDRWISEKRATPEGSTFFSASTTPIWTIDSRTSLTYLSDARTPPLRISSFPVGSTNSKNDGDTDVYVAYPLPCRYLQHRSLQIILYCIIVFGWSEPIITEIEWIDIWVAYSSHLLSFHLRGADWKNLSQRLTEICLSEILSGFLFPTHLTEISTFCLTNNQKISFWIRSL